MLLVSSPLTKKEQRAGAASVAGGTYLHLISVETLSKRLQR